MAGASRTDSFFGFNFCFLILASFPVFCSWLGPVAAFFAGLFELLDIGGKLVRAEVTDFEWATRLAYFLWNSMPDDELYRLAKEGALQNRSTRQQQVERMLAALKARL